MSGAAGRTVVGLFERPEPAETAIRALKVAGFADQDIGVVMRDLGRHSEVVDPPRESGDGAAGAVAGAATGGMVGGVLGMLGSLLLPGVGPIVAGGVLGSALVGAGAGAATGGVIGGLVGMGVPPDDARHFDRGFRAGGVILTVKAAGEAVDTAARLLRQHGADLGPSHPARGPERRVRRDPAYRGPERRVARI